MVFTHTDTRTGVDFGSALANDDVAGDDGFTAEFFDAETSSGGITVVLG